MARSKYVYTVLDPGLPPEGFTVKHELLWWLKDHPDPGGRVIWRGHDGRAKHQAPVVVNPLALGVFPAAGPGELPAHSVAHYQESLYCQFCKERATQEDLMPYQMIHEDDYPGSGFPIYRVYDAEEYQDASVRSPRPIGEVWGVGIRGVSGIWLQTGVRWQLAGTGMLDSVLIEGAGAGVYGNAARVMIAEYEAV